MKKLITIALLSTAILSCDAEEEKIVYKSDFTQTPSSGQTLDQFLDAVTSTYFPADFPKYTGKNNNGEYSISSGDTKTVLPFVMEERTYHIESGGETYDQYKTKVENYVKSKGGSCASYTGQMHPNTTDKFKCKYDAETKFTLEKYNSTTGGKERIKVSILKISDEKTWTDNLLVTKFNNLPKLSNKYNDIQYGGPQNDDLVAVSFFVEADIKNGSGTTTVEEIPAVKAILDKVTSTHTCTLAPDSDNVHTSYDYLCINKTNQTDWFGFKLYKHPSSLYGYYAIALSYGK